MTRWKAITLDYSDLLDYDDEEIIQICLTQRQVAILKALLTTAYWVSRWSGLTISEDELNAYVANIDFKLDGNDCEATMFQLRDNPDDLCEVQQTLDGGETWITAFRKDVCPPDIPVTTTTIINTYINIETVTTNNTNYAGDIINVAPKWEYGATTDEALCYVVNAFVEFVCEAAIKQIETGNQQRRESNNWIDDIAIVVAEMVLDVALATSGIGTLPALLIGAVTWASVQFVEAIWDAIATYGTGNYTDQDARDAVACWMFNKLKGGTPTFDKWAASLDAFEGENDHEVAVGTTVAVFNKDLDFYINFMILMEDVNDIAYLLPGCICPEPLIIDQLAGQTSEDFFGTEFTQPTALSLNNPGDTPAYAPGTWLSESEVYWSIPSSIGGVGCNVEVVLPVDVLVTQVRVTWGAHRPAGAGSGDKNAAVWLGSSVAATEYIAGHSWGSGVYDDQFITTTVNAALGFTSTPRTHLYIHNSMDRSAGFCYIQWIHIICIPYVP